MIVGVVGFVVVLLMSLGTLPGLATSATPCSTASASACVHADLTLQSQSGLSITVLDNSTALSPFAITAISVSWGDGSSNAVPLTGRGATHEYTAAGSYHVVDTVHASTTATPNAQPVTEVGTAALTVTVPKTTPPPPTTPTLSPGITYTVLNYGVVVTDHTTEIGVSGIVLTIAWGDAASSSISMGGTASHTYTSTGTYTITETATGTANGTKLTETASTSVPILGSSNGCGGSNASGCPRAPTPTFFIYNVESATLLWGFAGLALFVAIPGPISYRVAGIVVFLAVGFFSGALVGGAGFPASVGIHGW